jgi:hypothetical protein
VLGVAFWPEDDAPTAPVSAASPALAVEGRPADDAPEQTALPEANRRTREDEPREARHHAAEPRESSRAAEPEDEAAPIDGPAARAGASANTAGGGSRPFPRIQNTLDRIFGPSGSGGSTRSTSQADRRQALLARGPTHNNVAAAKRAYRAGQLNEQSYEDTIWVLKTRRARRIDAEKQNLRAGAISKEEYKRRVTRIDQEYEGS